MPKFCKNYKSPEKCSAGINIRELVGGEDFGWLLRSPCVESLKTEVSCDKRQFPPDEEEAERKRKVNEHLNLIAEAINRIKKITNAAPTWETRDETRTGTTGDIPCPKCGAVLYFAVAGGNHHISGQCSTPKCLNWMT